MSLSGNLGFVSLDEVLRLLVRSNQKGSVGVKGQDVRGRIFVTKGGLALATTSNDEAMHQHLIKSGLVDAAFLRSVESGETTLAPIVEKSGDAIVDLLREMTVETVYQLGLNGDSFEVQEGEETRYATPKPFDLESIIDDSKQRLTDWAEVSQTVSDLDEVMSISRDLGDRDEVTVNRDAWRVLSEIGSGSSVVSIAGELGTTDFWTARTAAGLINDDLLDVARVGSSEEVRATTEDLSSFSEPASGSEDVDEDVDPDESWWEEPSDEASETSAEEDSSEGMPVVETAESDEASEVKSTSIFGTYAPEASKEPAEVVEEDLSEVPIVGDAADDGEVEDADDYVEDADDYVEDADDYVEDDTEAFLEKVFSELDSSSDDEKEEEAEEEAGYGLLRRRRMGAIRDSLGDS